jgi:hypothetical protein
VSCVDEAQIEQIVVMQQGKPVAVVIGVGGMDTEQVLLGSSEAFWQFIAARRQEKTIQRDEWEKLLSELPPV